MAAVCTVKDIHKSLCLPTQKTDMRWDTHTISLPINDMGGRRFENCSCHHIRNKTNKDTEYDLKKLFKAKLTHS